MRSGHFFYRTTKLLDRQAETHLIYCKGSPFRVLNFNERYKTARDDRVPFLNFFRHCATFFDFFVAKVSPFKFFDISQQTEVSKSRKGLPFLLFVTMRLFQNSHSSFFPKIFSKKFRIFLIFCHKMDFQKVERVRLLQF